MKYLAIVTFSLLTYACSPAPEVTATSSASQISVNAEFDTSHMERMGFQVESAQAAQIAGLYQVITDQGLVYASADGKQIISGRIFDITGAEPKNISEAVLDSMRVKDLAAISNTIIEYQAPEEKHIIHVFTDTSCGYCRQLHERIDEYLALGITVRYLAWPRNGLQSKAATDLQNVWCANDQQAAMTAAKTDAQVPVAVCNDPVSLHFSLGQKFGVRGTPAIVLESGQMLPGYVPPSRLLGELEKTNG